MEKTIEFPIESEEECAEQDKLPETISIYGFFDCEDWHDMELKK